MKARMFRYLVCVLSVVAFWMVAVACYDAREGVIEPDLGSKSEDVLEIPSGNRVDRSVDVRVSYLERIALSSGARLVVELRDVSLQDSAAPLVSRRTIYDPGQVPIEVELGYSSGDIKNRNTYGVQATIFEADGRMAFTNDTAYDVITRGNPDRMDMRLVLVQPPPGLVEEGDPDWRSWIEVPVEVTGVELLDGEQLPTVRVTYLQSTVEGCARRGTEAHEVVGDEIRLTVTLMEHPETAWSPDCDAEVVELDAIAVIESGLETGLAYRVLVNGVEAMVYEHE